VQQCPHKNKRNSDNSQIFTTNPCTHTTRKAHPLEFALALSMRICTYQFSFLGYLHLALMGQCTCGTGDHKTHCLELVASPEAQFNTAKLTVDNRVCIRI
jgi:hypothetical protein